MLSVYQANLPLAIAAVTTHWLQLMFLTGVALTIGPRATMRFFMRRKNWKVCLQISVEDA